MRAYRARDREACAEIYERVQREVFPDDDPKRYHRGDFRRATHGEELWVAEVSGAVVGFASFWRPEPFLHYLLIDRAWRRRGVGTALLRQVLEAASGPVDLKCDPRNAAARRYYEARGWRLVERQVSGPSPYLRYRFSAEGPE